MGPPGFPHRSIIFFSCLLVDPKIRPMKPGELFDLSGEVAVVVGATGELGGALAQGLGEAGAQVAVLGRNPERGQARVKTIQSAGGTAAFFAADAAQKGSLRATREAIEKSLGAPTILVNAVGGNDPKVTVT